MNIAQLQTIGDAAWAKAEFDRTTWRNLRPYNQGLADSYLRKAIEVERALEKLGYIPRDDRLATGDRDVLPEAFTPRAKARQLTGEKLNG